MRPAREWGRGGLGVGEWSGAGPGGRPPLAAGRDGSAGWACGPGDFCLVAGPAGAARRCPPKVPSASQLSAVAGGGRRAGRGTARPARSVPPRRVSAWERRAGPQCPVQASGAPPAPRGADGTGGPRRWRAGLGPVRSLGRRTPSPSPRGIFCCLMCDSGRRSASSIFLAASRGDFPS